MNNTSTHEFFGGAITMDAPSDIVSFANFRRLGDHEELFGSLTRDLLCHVEILTVAPETPLLTHAMEHHWMQLAKDNECPDETFYEVYEVEACPNSIKDAEALSGFVIGIQTPKEKNVTLSVGLIVVRIESLNVDLLVSFTSSELPLSQVAETTRLAAPTINIKDLSLFA